ncbi:hypothetical protein DXX93_01910 [Thalassotalea euphylliae]|uniref:Uncharacterized protein n=1 Tax=Thalassotalea euphylliae TaxID=1655234 RepID=A0A3E0TLM6_9GAMM|nr:hypothetical protein [Thalassotalea euphylliae]REL25426.1 hypothetical protein DXX93_01910 [Thalassotalea euphylliae]
MNDKQRVKETINAIYTFAGIGKKFTGDVNPKVAEVVGNLLKDINSCSTAFSWVPQPTGGKATISWIAKNMSRSILEQLKNDQSYVCARARVWQYVRPIQLASQGV